MKRTNRLLNLLVIVTAVCLAAPAEGAGFVRAYTEYLPKQRLAGNMFPAAWATLSGNQPAIAFYDSSYTLARWDRWYAPSFDYGYLTLNESTHLTAVYVPAASGIRWGAAVDWLNTEGPQSIGRQSVTARLKSRDLDISLYQINHLQTLELDYLSDDAQFDISSAGAGFIYTADSLLTLDGDLSYYSAAMEDSILRRSSELRAAVGGNWQLAPGLSLKTGLDYRSTVLDDETHSLTAFTLSGNYRRQNLRAKAGLYLSQNLIFPEISLRYGTPCCGITLFSKVEEPPVVFNTENGCVGINGHIKTAGRRFKQDISLTMSENLLRTPAGLSPRMVLKGNGFLSLKLGGSFHLFSEGDLHYIPNPMPCIYYPVIGNWKAGLTSYSTHVHGNLILDLKIFAGQVYHDDPDSVSFDISTLTYRRNENTPVISDWVGGISLDAIIKQFTLGLEFYTPFSFDENFLILSLVDGLRTSSDLTSLEIMRAALNISWYWWR